ncbi:MAG: hypothetical protein FWD38_01610 [Oscillospiraceae bacterium]|nr:hypothetical protein [Oscillospiraceae bacterium]
METSIAILFAIIFIIVAINFYLMIFRNRRGTRYKKMGRVAVDEAKQALWRDNEIQRRIKREEEDALERFKLREETLALYDEVRNRAAARDYEGTLLTGTQWEDMQNADIERFR